jgi:hypothetical protein
MNAHRLAMVSYHHGRKLIGPSCHGIITGRTAAR